MIPFLAAFLPGRSTVVLALSALVAGFAGGYWCKAKFDQAERVAAVERAIVAERKAVEIGNQVEADYLARLDQQRKDANGKIRDLQKRLAAVPGCPVPVPADWLRGGADVSTAARSATGLKGTAESLAAVADSRTVVEYCERARLEAFEPNAEQIRALQRWIDQQRAVINQ